MNVSDEIQQGFKLAKAAREHAYAPYSNFQVGAAIKAKGSEIVFVGCNVENASYGGTVCAERVAVWSMIACQGKSELEWVVLITDTPSVVTPCGNCRQVLAEFSTPDCPIYLSTLDGVKEVHRMEDLLPMAFNRALPKQAIL